MKGKFSEGKPYKVVALCYSRFSSYDQMRVADYICRNCEANNIKLALFTTASDLSDGSVNDMGEARVFDMFDVTKFDAVVMLSETVKTVSIPEKLAKKCADKDVPFISVDRKVEGAINISFTYGNSFEEVVNHIIVKHNIKDICMIAGFRGNEFSDERIERCKNVMKYHGLELSDDNIIYGDFWMDPTDIAVKEYIQRRGGLPQAFVCANDIMAITCIRTLRAKGYSVPEDVIVTGFDGIELVQYYSPRLTTAAYEDEELLKTIVEAVFANSDGKRDLSERFVKYHLQVGGSCGCKDNVAFNAEERLYLEKYARDDREYFVQFMYNMIGRLSNCEQFSDIFDKIPRYTSKIALRTLWMCFEDEFLDDEMNIRFSYGAAKDKNKSDSEIIRYYKYHLDEPVGSGCFNKQDLMPDFISELENNNWIMFTPLHIHGDTVGYFINTYDIDIFNTSYFQTFLLDFRHMLETYANRTFTERMYVTDLLSNIYNRHGFYKFIGDIIKQSIKNDNPITILSMDMDGLKIINDTYGHAEGDFAISKIAEAMRLATTEEELCSRFGGDEFVIAYTCQNGNERAKEIENAIYKVLDDFNATGEKAYPVKVSIGVHSHICDSEDSLDELIKCADNHMYEQKKQHKMEQAED